MKNVSCEDISALVAKLCIRAATELPADVASLMERAAERETCPAAKAALGDLVENFKYAAESGMPICQDTGMAVVFADVGQEVRITGGLFEDAVNEGVRRGYETGYLRKSVVGDPLRRVNTDDNTPAVIHTRLVAGDEIRITVAPKGFGSENMSALIMLLPSATAEVVADTVADAVVRAGAKPCPPLIVGVGLGGTAEQAMLAAKRALLRPGENPDGFYASLEADILARINARGCGAQGFGGSNTALAVRLEPLPTHIAGLPCAVNISCHADRHAEGVL
ncbi:MAG: fumarate hydratase [Oscillospiraceae bacterium]|nr:fumarate hydratase [Oscillospiraceae bacterium]